MSWIRKTALGFAHLLQIGLVIFLTQVRRLYYNRLGFMRNVSFYSKKIEANLTGYFWLISTIILLITVWLVVYYWKTKPHRKGVFIEIIWLLIIVTSLVVWQGQLSLEHQPLYIIVNLIFLGLWVIQVLLMILINRWEGSLN